MRMLVNSVKRLYFNVRPLLEIIMSEMFGVPNPSCHSRFIIEVVVTINQPILKYRVEIISRQLIGGAGQC